MIKKNIYLTIAIFIAVAMYFNYPYYLYGDNSAIGWYDEFDLPITSMLADIAQESNFSQMVAGGSYLSKNYLPINQGLNLYEILVRFFGNMPGSAIYRVITQLLIMLGFYLSFGERFKDREKNTVLMVISTIFITYYGIYVYGWTLGGYGLVFFCSYILFYFASRSELNFITLIICVFIGLISAKSYIMVSVYVPLALLVSFLWWLAFVKKRFFNYSLIVAISLLSTLIFSIDEIRSMFELSKDSARAMSYKNQAGLHQFSLIDLLKECINTLHFVLVKQGGTIFLSLIAINIYFKRYNTIYNVFLIFSAEIILFILLSSISYLFNIWYRWEQLFIVAYPITLMQLIYGIFSAHKKENIFAHRLNIILPSLLIIGIISSSLNLHTRTKHEIKLGHTWSYLNEVKNTANYFESDYRVYIETPYSPKPEFLQLAGVRTLDGMRPTFTPDRTLFWFKVLSAKPINEFHTHRQTAFNINEFGSNATDQMLEMANVKYVLSNKQLNMSEEIISESFVCGNFSILCWSYLSVNSFLFKIKKPALYVRTLNRPWPFIFVPKKIIKLQYDLKADNSYFDKLRDVDYLHVLENSPDRQEVIEFDDWGSRVFTFKDGWLVAKLEASDRVIVINQELSKAVKFYCNGSLFSPNLKKVNLIMSKIEFDQSCVDFSLQY